MSQFSRVFAIALGAVLAACSGPSTATGPDGAGAPPAIAGGWASACTVASPQQIFRMRFDLTTTTWKLDYVVYGDTACATEFLTVHIEGGYHLTIPSPVVGGAWQAEFAFGTKTVVPHVDAAAQFLASPQGCNRPGFTTGQATDILDAGCAGLGAYPVAQCAAEHDIVLRGADTLQFGARPADNNLCSDDRRPTAASPVVLAKQ